MAETMQFDLVSPERSLASLQAHAVQLPASEGDMTAMPNHAPTITTLRPGMMNVIVDGDVHQFVVTGGFAQISTEGTTVLAEQAYPNGPEAKAALEAALAKAKETAEAAVDHHKDTADKLVADFAHLLEQMA
ncbi:MAG: ATP synthase F1 subunit epsilon [Pseudomonadota bacterium]